jgi:uncharacterized membrane protein YccC
MQLLRDAFRPTVGSHLDLARGARAAVAMLLPLFTLEALGRNQVGSQVAVGTLLGVIFVAFCDIGPTLRVRVRAMGCGAVVGALLILLGSWIGGSWWVAVPAIALATFLSGILPAHGQVVAQVGIILTMVFTVALGKDGGLAAAWPAMLGFLFGGTFFLALVLSSFVLFRFMRLRAREPALRPPPAVVSAPGIALPGWVLLVRLALLRAVGAGLMALVAWGSGVPYPHWAPVVVIASIRTDQVAAVNLARYRIIGTVLGAGLANMVLLWVHSPLALAGLAVAGMFLAFAVKDANNTSFIFFLTFLILVLLNISATGPAYVALRVATTLIGAAAALIVSWLSFRLVRHAAAATRPPPAAPPAGSG